MTQQEIDLDAICTEEAKTFATGSLKEADTMALYLRNVMNKVAAAVAEVAAEEAYRQHIYGGFVNKRMVVDHTLKQIL